MKRLQSVLLISLVTVMLLGLAATASAQGLKVGWVNDEKIKAGYAAWGRAEEQIRIEAKAWDDEGVTKQTELQDMLAEYDKQKMILSEPKRQEREAAIRVKRDDLDEFTKRIFSPGGALERRQEELLMPLIDNVTKAISQFAEAEGYDVIFTNQSGLGYIKESLDVTDKVLEYLEKLDE